MPKLTAIRKLALDGIVKEAIFQATVATLSEHGVKGLTMERVASEAGVAKGSLYRYFTSKRELIEFVHARLIDPLFEQTQEIVISAQSAMEKLSGHLHMLLEHVGKYAQIHKLLFEDEVAGLLQSSQRRTLEAACRQLAKIFRQGIDERVFRPGDPLMLANMYVGLSRGALEQHLELAGPDQRENVHDLIMNTFLNGIRVEKDSLR
ncbi:MAG: TetR/AcrR family transcriptional regulator [Thermoguttaceae bacterium]